MFDMKLYDLKATNERFRKQNYKNKNKYTNENNLRSRKQTYKSKNNFTRHETHLPVRNSLRILMEGVGLSAYCSPCQSNCFTVVEWGEERDEQAMSKPLRVGNVNESK